MLSIPGEPDLYATKGVVPGQKIDLDGESSTKMMLAASSLSLGLVVVVPHTAARVRDVGSTFDDLHLSDFVRSVAVANDIG